MMLLQLSQVINVHINLIVLCGFSSCFTLWNELNFTGSPLEILTYQNQKKKVLLKTILSFQPHLKQYVFGIN